MGADGQSSQHRHGVTSRETRGAGEVTVARAGDTRFAAPFAAPGPAVLYLQRTGR